MLGSLQADSDSSVSSPEKSKEERPKVSKKRSLFEDDVIEIRSQMSVKKSPDDNLAPHEVKRVQKKITRFYFGDGKDIVDEETIRMIKLIKNEMESCSEE